MSKSRVKYESVGVYLKHSSIVNDFKGFVKYIRDQEKAENLPKNYVPQTIYWMVDGSKFLGWLSLRHYLNKNLKRIGGHIGYEVSQPYRGRGYGNMILKLGLKEAHKWGIKRVFITCDEDNVRSKKVIEQNGGKAIRKVWQNDKNIYKLRFWINN